MTNHNNKNNNETSKTNNNQNPPSGTMEETCRRLAKKLEPYLYDEDCPHFCQHWVSVGGGPGSGKSTVAKAVADRLNAQRPDSAVVIGMDGWHFPQKEVLQMFGEEGMKRRGAPWTINVAAMVHDITRAKHDGEALLPEYCREISNPVPGAIKLTQHHKVVFVEGLYVLMKDTKEWAKMFDLWDETWFVECPSREEQIDRVISRSLKTWNPRKRATWGEGEEGARKRVEYNDVPNMGIVDPSRKFAEEIIVTK